jgi:hypothetical protein
MVIVTQSVLWVVIAAAYYNALFCCGVVLLGTGVAATFSPGDVPWEYVRMMVGTVLIFVGVMGFWSSLDDHESRLL